MAATPVRHPGVASGVRRDADAAGEGESATAGSTSRSGSTGRCARCAPRTTVPALVLDGRRIQTTGAIARELDRIRPDPPLLPADPEARARVETIEAWCDRDFQQMGRRLVYWALVRDGSAVDSYLEGVEADPPEADGQAARSRDHPGRRARPRRARRGDPAGPRGPAGRARPHRRLDRRRRARRLAAERRRLPGRDQPRRCSWPTKTCDRSSPRAPPASCPGGSPRPAGPDAAGVPSRWIPTT